MKIGKSKNQKYWKAQGGALVGGYQPRFGSSTIGTTAPVVPILNAVGTAASASNPYLLAAQLGMQALKAGVGAYQYTQGQRTLQEAEATRPGTSVSEYADIAKRALESDVLRAQQERLDRTLAASLEASTKAPGGASQVSNILQASEDASQAASMQQQALQMQALGQLAQAKEAELGRREARFQEKAGMAMQAAGAGAENILGAIGGVGQDIGKYQQLGAIQNYQRYMENGGMMTDGSFNHKKNPIDIIQKGQKVGEMTGGEVILNPKQQQAVASQSPYFRRLLKKFNSQK